MITASTPIIMTEDGNEAAVAVVGAQLRYSKFYDMFMNATKLCSSSSNEVLCHDLCQHDVSKRHCIIYSALSDDVNPFKYQYLITFTALTSRFPCQPLPIKYKMADGAQIGNGYFEITHCGWTDFL